MTKEPSIEDRLDKARIDWDYPRYVLNADYSFTESELHSLLEAYAKEIAEKAWHESNMITRIRVNQAGCSKEVDDAMSDAVLEFDKWYASVRNAPSPTEKQ